MAREISNFDDVIDSRDVIERIEELEADVQALRDAQDDAAAAINAYEGDTTSPEFELLHDEHDAAAEALNEWNHSDEADELKALRELVYEASDYASDWGYGEALIRDSHFTEYAMELAEDIGAINPNASWPLNCIDWDQAARELQMDYTAVDFDGVTYWIR